MDEDLRELERAAQRGDPEARARLIAAWRRAGRLDEVRLMAAAHLGDPVARALLGSAAPLAVVEDVLPWLESVRERPWSPEITLLAAVVGARAALSAFERQYPEDRGPRRCVEAAEAAVACPCAEHAQQALTVGEWGERAWREGLRRRSPEAELSVSDATRAQRAAFFAAQAAGSSNMPDRARMLASVAATNAFGVVQLKVHDAARVAVVRWLLGV